ncbi:hypothetical protein FGO68_gene8361 [Halteria grandinella]|uniref:AB hydrolase-1 domain-containing protein n=1 Tax=Halteria grandinella TaxID=5974 RepID=A0A8J8NNB3_HALGN|nr:hypothetical protein FGO68_gene8361 [Halteria grandinella]
MVGTNPQALKAERKDDYFDEAKFAISERKVLAHSGIEPDLIKISNVPIDTAGNYIRTIEIGTHNEKPTLVLIHGYGGSSVKFWKIAKPLSEQYHLLMIDIVGMGGSSRPEFGLREPAEVDVYLTEWLERWRQNVYPGQDFKDFVLIGHSFGGYVSGLYTIQHPQNVRKLIMLSPLGISRIPEGFNLDHEIDKLPESMRPPKFLIKFISMIWSSMSSPYELMRKTGPWMSSKLLDFYASKRFTSLHGDELEDYKEYMKHTLLRPASTDDALFINFDHLLFAKRPLQDPHKLGGLDKPISFIFGDRDWMLRHGGEEVLRQNPYTGRYSHMHIVKDSDHHLYFDNPAGLTEAILKDLENLHEMPKF